EGRHDGLVVSVTAKLWWWEVRYRLPSSGKEIVLANEIRIPVGRPVTFALTSSDVIHSFWVPALAGKVDMLPNRIHHLRVERAKPASIAASAPSSAASSMRAWRCMSSR